MPSDVRGAEMKVAMLTDLLAARDAEIARMKAKRDEAAVVTKAAAMLISEIAALVPIPEALTATYSAGDLIAWVRRQKEERDAAREALRLAAPIVRDHIMEWSITDGLTTEDRREGMAPSIDALRAIVAIVPDALDGAPEWVWAAVADTGRATTAVDDGIGADAGGKEGRDA